MSLRDRLASTAAAAAKVPAATVVALRPTSGAGDADPMRALLDELESIPDKAPPKQEKAAPAVPADPGLDPTAGTVANDAVLHDINTRTFLSHCGDGVVRIYREAVNAETGNATQTVLTEQDLNAEFAVRGAVRLFDGTKWTRVRPGTAWLAWPLRRSYPTGIGMWPEADAPPGAFNLYRGFGVEPRAGDAAMMVEHVRMLCGGSADLSEYFLNWMAFSVQRPGSRAEVAVVLRGGQGTGKGTVAKALLRIHGAHGLHVTQSRHVVGHFNAALRNTVFVFLDEAWYAGDKAAEGVLKGLITEPTLVIENKGRDAIGGVPNRLKALMASNSSWVIPAGADERRYCVIDVPSDRAQDHAYFSALHGWLDAGGTGIFLQHLLDRDLSSFNVRSAPRTAALDAQKIEALSVLDRFLLNALDTAAGLSGGTWPDLPAQVSCSGVAHAYAEYAHRFGAKAGRVDARSIGRRLHEVLGVGPAAMSGDRNDRSRAWTVPGLAVARTKAAQAFGLSHYQWGQA